MSFNERIPIISNLFSQFEATKVSSQRIQAHVIWILYTNKLAVVDQIWDFIGRVWVLLNMVLVKSIPNRCNKHMVFHEARAREPFNRLYLPVIRDAKVH
jgi:hypothetical protein